MSLPARAVFADPDPPAEPAEGGGAAAPTEPDFIPQDPAAAAGAVAVPPPAPPAWVPEGDSVRITPWIDRLIDTLGHDPRSLYVEQFWLGILGPSTTWLLRRLADRFQLDPDGFELPLADTAKSLGLGHTGGRNSPFARSLGRLCSFHLAEPAGEGVLAVRRHVPPLTERQVRRLSPGLQAAHGEFVRNQARTPPAELLRRRARQLALSLVELGEDRDATERNLTRWRFHPTLCREATDWAWARHEAAARAVAGGGA